MFKNQDGNVAMVLLIGAIGIGVATTQWDSIYQSTKQAERHRGNLDADTQSLAALSVYKGLLSSKGANQFGIYPEPYLQVQPKLEQITANLPGQYQHTTGLTTLNLQVPRTLSNNQLEKIMTGTGSTGNPCSNLNPCAPSTIKLIGYNYDVASDVPQRIVSADVEVTTQVLDPKTQVVRDRIVLAQVPIESPKVTDAILRVTELRDNMQVESTNEVFKGEAVKNVTINQRQVRAELIVGGVALDGEITIVENNQTIRSSDPEQWGVDNNGFPLHKATSIKNSGTKLVTIPLLSVEDGNTYTLIGRVKPINKGEEVAEIKMVLQGKLPNPPDPNSCKHLFKDLNRWHCGPFPSGNPGIISEMIPGKYSCMSSQDHDGLFWDGAPIFSFDPANGCAQDPIPVGFRTQNIGCFAEETMIRMGDGSERKIASIRAGDQVWNPIEQRAYSVKKVTAGPEYDPLVSLSLSQGQVLRVTADHPFVLADEGLAVARELEHVILADGTRLAVQGMREIGREPTTVWNLELDAPSTISAHAIVANGVITGDLYLQKRLQDRDPFAKAMEGTLDLFADAKELEMARKSR